MHSPTITKLAGGPGLSWSSGMSGLRGIWSGVSNCLSIRRSSFAMLLAMLALALGAGWPQSASAIDLNGLVAPAAIDQPQINVIIRNAPGGNPIVGDVGDPLDPFNPNPTPSINFQAYLDTGASGILLSNNTALGW